MKGIHCLFLGLVLGAGSASAQVIGFRPQPDSGLILIVRPQVSIRTMAPDRMPCLVPNLAFAERMPVRRSSNADPMPNGFRSGRVWSVEVRPAEK